MKLTKRLMYMIILTIFVTACNSNSSDSQYDSINIEGNDSISNLELEVGKELSKRIGGLEDIDESIVTVKINDKKTRVEISVVVEYDTDIDLDHKQINDVIEKSFTTNVVTDLTVINERGNILYSDSDK